MSTLPQSIEDLEIDLLLEAVFQCYGHDFRGYRKSGLKRRLHPLMRAGGLHTVSGLQERVLHDADYAALLLRTLTVRPVSMFDPPGYFQLLRETMVPWLRSFPTPTIWLAECVSAEDACALAILLVEEGLHDRTRVFATAENASLLQEASGGGFALARLAEYARNYRRSGGKRDFSDYYHTESGRGKFAQALRSNITWSQYSLATDASFNEFQMIVCRRTISDFDSRLRQRAFQLFYDSMPLFGILSVDQQDDLSETPFVSRYRPISEEVGLYRRII